MSIIHKLRRIGPAAVLMVLAGGAAARTDRYGDPLPEGVIARLGTIQLRAWWAQVGLSADGKTIVTVTRGRQVVCWDAETGRLRRRGELPIDSCEQAFLSSDGRLLAIQEPRSDTPIDVWDVSSGKRLHRLPLPKGGRMNQAAFSPDGRTLAVATMGAAPAPLRLWDLESAEQHLLKGPANSPGALAFSPDGKRLAASDGSGVFCWDIAKRELLWQSGVGLGASLAFTPDDRTLIASPGHRQRTWDAWDAATGKPSDHLKLPEGYNYARLAVAPDGRTLVFASSRAVQGADGRVRFWDMREGKLLRTLAAGGQIGPFAPDGRSVLTNDGALQRWELATGRPLLPDTEERGHRAEVSRAVWSPDGRRLASAACDGTIRLWEVATTRPLHILRGREWEATALAFTPDGKQLLSAGNESEVGVWDTQTGKEIRRIPLHNSQLRENKQHVWKLHMMPDGQSVLVLGYDPGEGQPLLSGILTTLDLTTGEQKSRSRHERSDGFYSEFSPDGRTLASRGALLDTATGKTRLKLQSASRSLAHYAFSPDGRLVAGLLTRTVREGNRFSTQMEGIQLWDAESGRARRRIPTDWVGQLAFSPDGHYLAAADVNGVRLWELATGQVALRHRAHEKVQGSYGHSFASCLSFAPDGRALATGHLDSTILIWDLVPPVRPATAGGMSVWWEDLGSTDGGRAYAASWRLAEAPAEATAFLRERLRPVIPAPAEQTGRLLADLDSAEFRRREAAAAGLRELGDRAATALREALRADPSLEKRRRVEELLASLEGPPSGETLRRLRAVTVLERIGSTQARQILTALSHGMPEARVTQDARASLQRCTARSRTHGSR